jgi:quercetin dioxygenase-like cupin family protein
MRALTIALTILTSLILLPRVIFAAGSVPAGAKVEQLLRQPLADKPGTDVLLIRVVYPPGGATPPHTHPAFVYAYVVDGSVVSQLDNQKPQTYTAGQLWSETPGQHHMISRNASTRAAATLLVFMIIPHNAQLLGPIAAGH